MTCEVVVEADTGRAAEVRTRGRPLLARLEDEAKDLADDLRGGLAPARGGWANQRRKLASHRSALASAFENRRRLRRGDECLRPTFFIWTMTNRCNFACEYCDNHRGVKYPDLPEGERLGTADGRRLLQIMRTGTTALYFCGGEPTLRRDLPELTREAWSLDYFPLMINTNASRIHRRLADPEWSDWLAHTDIVICSLDSLDPDCLDELYVTRDGEHVIRNVLLVRELSRHTGVKAVVNTVIQPDRIAEAAAVFDWAVEKEIFFVPVPVNHGPSPATELLDDDEYVTFARRILDHKRKGGKVIGSRRMLEKLLFQVPLECYPSLKPHVDPDGSVLWPCKPCVNVEPMPVNVLDHATLDDVWAAGRKIKDPTRFHGQGPQQCGADCGWAQNYASELYAEGLLHPIQTGFLAQIREFTTV